MVKRRASAVGHQGAETKRFLTTRSSAVSTGPSGYHPDFLAFGGAGWAAYTRKLRGIS